MNSGFANLRSALPMNLKARHPGYKIWAGAQPDIDRIVEIWTECLATYGGPLLFGKQRGMADAMFAPVVTRFLTYDVKLDKPCFALLPDDHGDAGDAGVDRRRASASPTTSKSSTWTSRARPRLGAARRALAARRGHGLGSGTAAGAGMSTVVKSAGPTTSRYSMSGE